MSRVADLAIAGRSPAAKFHELRLKYWNNDIDVVCCFEGGDDVEFYLPHVRQRLALHRERVDFLNCGGKGIVLTLLGWVKNMSWNLARLGFFVDRDLDDYLAGNLSSSQLYLTDCYSIESHVVDQDFFDNVWQDFFRLSMTDVRREVWKRAFYDGSRKLARLLFPMIYMAVAYKRSGGRVDFDQVKLDELIVISPVGDVGRRSRRHPSSSYSNVFFDATPSKSDIRAARYDLSSEDYRSWLRGKFLLWYAVIFFSRMKAALGSRKEPSRAVVRFNFSADTAVGFLCSRVSVPQSLSTFLDDWAALIVYDGVAPAKAVLGSVNLTV
ncbi:MAG: DUF4435 domain-containing protein [Rhodanobacteraceae bacterium]|jgi:hypothetical protein|nr:DUF4435 domain-containing protein [Rhodanobacteraceae bacterium]